MKASSIKRAMVKYSEANRPLMIWGEPGVGKSTVGRQFANEAKRNLYEFSVNGMEPIDLYGICTVKEGKTVWNPPNFLPTEPGGIIQIEDLPNSHPQVLTALMRLILDGKIGDYELPADTFIIANGNRESDKSYVTKLPTALNLRFAHLTFDFNLNDWIDNAIDCQFDMSVLCFGRAFPQHISAFDPNSKEKAQPVPRTWEFVSDIMKTNPDKDLIHEMIEGIVGKGAAMEFVAFLEVFNDASLPDVGATLKNPLSLKELPTKPSIMYAFIGAMAKRVDEKTIGNFLVVADRMIAEKVSEFAITMVNDAMRYNSNLKETSAYINWISKNQKYYN